MTNRTDTIGDDKETTHKGDPLKTLIEDTNSRVQEVLTPSIFSVKELKMWTQHLGVQSDVLKKIKIRQIAKQKNVERAQILQEIRNYAKSQIRERENGPLRHFHRTSMANFEIISDLGALMSRTELKKKKPNIKLLGWSASDDVMMTRDKYNVEGNLVKLGLSDDEVVGAIGAGVVLVFKDEIMNADDYDAIGQYPTMSNLPIQQYCEVILADSEETLHAIRSVLLKKNLHIPVALRSDWRR